MNLLVVLLVVVFLTALRDRPGVPLRTSRLLPLCTVFASAYYFLRVI